MFGYCTTELGMTRHEAFSRITAARTARDYPELYAYVADGKLLLTAIKRLAPHLTHDNSSALFDAASGKTIEGVEHMLAQRFPKPDVPTSLRTLPQPRQQQPSPRRQSAKEQPTLPTEAAVEAPALPSTPLHPSAPGTPRLTDRPKLEPLSPKRYKLQLTASQELVDKLKTAQHLLKHQLPAGDIDAVVERALDELIDTLKKKRFAAGSTRPRKTLPRKMLPRKMLPRKTPAPTAEPKRGRMSADNSRYVRAADKREVFERDGMRCTFSDDRGRRCAELGGLELAHIQPHGRRGSTDAHNLRLRCKAHNRLDADRDYGRDNMNRAVAEARRRPPSVNSHNPAPADVTALVSERVVDPPQVEMFGPR